MIEPSNHRRLKMLAMLCAAGCCLASPTPADSSAPAAYRSEVAELPEHTVERRPFLMGTLTRIAVTAPTREEALATTSAIERILRSAEDQLSTWRGRTELDRFNHAPVGRPAELSRPLDSELRRALACAEATDGTFDPTVGALVQAWDLRGDGRVPRKGELEDARRRSGRHLLARKNGVWTRRLDVLVDEGGFGKGAALDRVERRLTGMPPRRALVDLGGQFLLFDSRADPRPWPLGVADPDDRSLPVLRLVLPHGSVATSANSERSRAVEDATVGHLLDPRTGEPAHDFGSVTVWAPTGLEADCLATGLFVAGPDAAIEFAARQANVEVVVIERRGSRLTARVSEGLRERVEAVSTRLSLLTSPTHHRDHPSGARKPPQRAGRRHGPS